MRTDGTPTYNFCVVVDDVTMKITHVIRGNDHLSNTPKQIALLRGARLPAAGLRPHPDDPRRRTRARLSKRHGATSVLAFRDEGILPEAMVNYLARLGWSHGDQEIFTREELVRALRPGPRGHGRRGLRPDEARVAVPPVDQGGCPPSAWPRSSRPSSSGAGLPAPARPRRGSRAWWTRCRSGRAPSSRWPSRPRFYFERPRPTSRRRPAKFWKPSARPSATRS